MDEEYDAIVLGTGLKECIISGLLSVSGRKVLHMDRNDFYGGASASLTPLKKLYEHFKRPDEPSDSMGRGRDWNVDLIPKFVMAGGLLTKALLYTDVTRYLEFKGVEGSFVFKRGGKLHKVPSTEKEALMSGLMGMFEKRRFRSMLIWLMQWDEKDPATWQGLGPDATMKQAYAKFGCDTNTQDFTGHALALFTSEDYLNSPITETIPRVRLYRESVGRFGNDKSPYLYPMYGLGELPQGFARLSAIYGGTYMLAKPFEGVTMGEDGRVNGVTSEGQTAKTKMVIGDPSYFPEKVKQTGSVVRSICIMDHPIPNTNNVLSCQIIVPGNQCDRKNDIYIAMVSSTHAVAADGRFIAIASTTVETDKPEQELALAFQIMGPVLEKFTTVDPIYEATDDGTASNIFVTSSYDAQSHFQSTMVDVLDVYKRATGEDLDLDKPRPKLEGEE